MPIQTWGETSKKERADHVAKAKAICDGARNPGGGLFDLREFTPAERKAVEEHLTAVEQIDTQTEKAEKADALMARIEKMGPPAAAFSDGSSDGRSWTGAVLEKSGGTYGSKALVSPAGSVTVATPAPGIVPAGAPAAYAASLLGQQNVAGDHFAFLQQSVRTDAAAFVAEGALKPTSTYSVTRKDGTLQVLAHLSEALPRFMFEDSSNLQRFLVSEMQRGLLAELDNQLVNGNGTAPNLAGILNTSGIQTQAYATDKLTTTRTAVAKLENLQVQPTAWILHPNDWQAIELAQVSAGSMVFAYQAGGSSQPAQQAARMLWGTPVLVSGVVAEGTALLGDFANAATLYNDGAGVRLDWSENVSDDFSKNQLRWRCEARFGLGVLQPSAFVKVSLTA